MGVKIERQDKVVYKLTNLKHMARRETQLSAVVGYTMPYATPVHENLEAAHASPTQAKYLEAPARNNREELRTIARTMYKATKSVGKATLAAATRLYGLSQDLVPVDTGGLRLSGFVCSSDKVDQASGKALRAGLARRRQEMARRRKDKR